MPHRQWPGRWPVAVAPMPPESGRQYQHFAVAFVVASVAFAAAFVAFAGCFVGQPPGLQQFVHLQSQFVPPHLHRTPTGQKYIQLNHRHIVNMMD